MNPPGADRDLGAGQGRQRGGGRTFTVTAADADTRRGEKAQAEEAGRLWVRATSWWSVLCASRGGWERVQTERGLLQLMIMDGGGGLGRRR